jgi:C4-dicarboxylate-specific signal transduction histidine kinase
MEHRLSFRPALRPKRFSLIPDAVAASPAAALSTSLALVVFVAWIDLLTGYEFTLSILYLVPVFLTTWLVGTPAALGIALIATLAWFFTDELAGHEYSHAFYRYWEAGIKLAIFAIFAALARSDERVQQQRERLEATAKLVAVGEMASMLAHQINQPLSAVVNYNKSCLRRLRSGNAEPEQLAEIMEQASQEAARASAIIHRVREFVRKREPDRRPTEINSLVEQTLSFMQAEAAKYNVAVKFEPAAGLPLADADRIMIEQVIVNLVKNGIEAMKDVERIRELRVATAPHEGRFVRVSVGDRGQGIPADAAEQLFEPFFTTKPEGMGLGLSVCRSIVEFHGGEIWATPEPDRGVTFSFTLPAA